LPQDSARSRDRLAAFWLAQQARQIEAFAAFEQLLPGLGLLAEAP
jgi:hypothetical protein